MLHATSQKHPARPSHLDPRVAFALAFIDRHLANPQLKVEQIARQVHLTPSRVRQLMHQNLHISLKQYILEKRMVHARGLLRSSFLSVKEVMAQVGIRDASHFSKTYKHILHVAPSQDRTTNSTNDPNISNPPIDSRFRQ